MYVAFIYLIQTTALPRPLHPKTIYHQKNKTHEVTSLVIAFTESKDKRLFAPIHCASQTGNVECLEVLLDGGTEVNCRGFAGATPLHITVSVRQWCFLFNHSLCD